MLTDCAVILWPREVLHFHPRAGLCFELGRQNVGPRLLTVRWVFSARPKRCLIQARCRAVLGSSWHSEAVQHVRDARASLRRHGETAWRHARDDSFQREGTTARADHEIPHNAGTFSTAKTGWILRTYFFENNASAGACFLHISC